MSRIAIAAPGYPFIGGGLGLTLLGLLLGSSWLAGLGAAAAGFFAYFFRDLERPIPAGAEVIVSPADGRVVVADRVEESQFLKGPARRLGIFMNVFDVHVNRAPVTGRVAAINYKPGGFQAAFRPTAAGQNEQQATLLEAENGCRVLVVQIAGVLARRIVSFVQPGAHLAKGERFGMICFGSRVDLYLPPECDLLVKVGEHLKAGSSIVGRWS